MRSLTCGPGEAHLFFPHRAIVIITSNNNNSAQGMGMSRGGGDALSSRACASVQAVSVNEIACIRATTVL